MATIVGTNGNNSWTVIDPGSFNIDGLGGVDTIDFGTSLRSDYVISQGPGGVVFVDSVSSASGQLHATLSNIELLQFNSRRDTLDLRSFFGDNVAPTVSSLTDNAGGTARNPVVFSLSFSEVVSGLAFDDFGVTNGSVLVVAGSGQTYSVTVQPAPNVEGELVLTLNAGAVVDGNNNALVQSSSASQAIDTLGPSFVSSTPAPGSTGVDSGTSLVLSFSETLTRGSGLAVLRDASGAAVGSWNLGVTGDATISGNTLTLTSQGALPAGTGLTLELPAAGVSDALGNPLGASGVGGLFSFITAPGFNGQIKGTAFADTIVASKGPQSIDGLGGVDRVVLAGARSDFSLAKTPSGYSLDELGGATTVDMQAVERLQFADTLLALDTGYEERGGQVAMILGAVFGRESVGNAYFVGIGLQLMDGGMGFQDLMQLALTFRLGAGFSNEAEVDLLYFNLVGALPPPDSRAHFVGLLDRGELSQSLLGVIAAQHVLNTNNINLAGLADTGLPYV